MEARPELYFCIRPKDPLMDRSTFKRRLRELDVALTEQLPGGVGGYDVRHDCSEVWLYDESLEPLARKLIDRHGFEIRAQEEILVREKPE